MSNSLLAQLKEIEQKTQRLKALYEKEQAKANQLKQKVQELEEELARQKNALQVQEQTNKISKLANAISLSGADVKQHKLLISQYIREIDTCIRLLSD